MPDPVILLANLFILWLIHDMCLKSLLGTENQVRLSVGTWALGGKDPLRLCGDSLAELKRKQGRM